jgi:DNA-binding transcriptional ArsR family regulator
MQWQTITDARAIKILGRLEQRRVLEGLMLGSRTVSQLAADLGLGLQATYYQVRQLEQLGLVRVEHQQARRGRAIKHYRASSEGFFIPFYATSAANLEGFIQQVMGETQSIFNNLLTQAGKSLVKNPKDVGIRLYVRDNKSVSDISADGEHFDTLAALMAPTAPAMMSTFMQFSLSRSAAKQLQRELLDLLLRYRHPSGQEGYLLHVGLVPTNEDGQQ